MATATELHAQGRELEDSEIVVNESEPMDSDELDAIVDNLITEAEDYIDTEEAPARIKASEYYDGEPYGNEEVGRSQVVTYDVRDCINMMLPQIMRTFFGPEKVVEFMPREQMDVQNAAQATDYINQVILSQDNNSFEIFTEIFRDALLKRIGIAKVDWQSIEKLEHEEYSGLDDQALQALISDPMIEASAIESYPDPNFPEPPELPDGQPPLSPMQTQEAPQLHDVVVRRNTETGRIIVNSIPPEEFLIDRRARSVDEASVVAHRRYMTVSELVELGYDFHEMLDLAGDEDNFDNNLEYQTRNPSAMYSESADRGESNRTVLYTEAFIKVDYDNDGVSELRRFCCAGDKHKVLYHHPVNSIPFIIFSPYPEPHRWVGQSVADVIMDVQLIKSMVLRNMLDSLGKAIHPDTAVVEGQANMHDVTSNAVGKIIRMRAPGVVQELKKDFTGREAFPMLDYLDQLKEDRTGMSKASMGLNPDALQSSTKAAVSATVSASQAQIELVCRNFAEMGMKPLFRKILKLLTKHHDKARMVRLRNTWVPVDPRSWDANMDVSVNVALGLGTTEERMTMLATVAGKQEAILQQLGPENPLVNYQQYHATLAKMTELSGFKDVGTFWTDPATYQPPPPKEPKPSPDEIFVTAQADKISADIELDKQKFSMDQEKMIRDDDLARDKLDAEIEMKKKQIESQYATTLENTQLRGMLDRDREIIRQEPQLQTN